MFGFSTSSGDLRIVGRAALVETMATLPHRKDSHDAVVLALLPTLLECTVGVP